MAIEKNELRRVMGHFATGVTVITSIRSLGRAAWADCQCVHFGLADSAAGAGVRRQEGRELSVFRREQSLYRQRAGVGPGSAVAQVRGERRQKFEGVSYKIGANGAPILDGALAYLECKVTTAIDGGDHTIYLGEIEQAETPHEGKPLLFFRGGYREIGD